MIKFKIVTPEGSVYEDEILQCTIPTQDGEITVLPNHIPLVSILKIGEIKFRDKDGEHAIALAGGFLEVRGGNELIILADNAERAEEIDIERAEEARKHAEELLKKADQTADIDFARIQAAMERELNRIRVGKRWKNLR
ncbi:F0F1 ATP synthase subunit epsilon [Patescibacteria group bacterium]|nr:F0F1 ATP synthase subunit epsilon [Patescibacteria group bacterium]MBU1896005.1 F0F1 ATP synthase subunit epsilon [Patescibacteria group bacterium]